ncbi:MAG: hypothetical protein D6744_01310, partial [Planctomycetota bacterium]
FRALLEPAVKLFDVAEESAQLARLQAAVAARDLLGLLLGKGVNEFGKRFAWRKERAARPL